MSKQSSTTSTSRQHDHHEDDMINGNIINELTARGFVAQTTDPNLEDLFETKQTVYVGFDPTADSLHLGHLIPIMACAHLQRAGHRVITLVGGATGMIGDPAGKSAERTMLTRAQVKDNARKLKDQLSHYVRFDGHNPAMMLDNHDWISAMSYIDWLRDVGKHFTVNYMLSKDSVKKRLASEQGISYTEFSYMTLQAYDFLHLYREHHCTVQAGGNDQWGNITAGIQLVQRVTGEQVYGLTFPLLSTSSGQKFGKSAGNAVWLDSKRTSSFKLYQYWMSTTDDDVEKFLKLFTFLSLDEIERVMAEHAKDPGKRVAQRRLAAEATAIIRGAAEVAKAQQASELLFGDDMTGVSDEILAEVFAEVPSASLMRTELEAGVSAVDLMVRTKLAKSKGEARRLLNSGGTYLNGRRLDDRLVTTKDLASETMLVLRRGKKSHCLVRVE